MTTPTPVPAPVTPVSPASLPHKVIVSLQAGGIFFALANVICVAILAYVYLSVKLEPKTLTVTGSAKKAIESDLISWNCRIATRDPNLAAAYKKLKADADRVKTFLQAAGVPEKEVTFSAVTTTKNFVKEFGPAPTNQIIITDKISSYELTQEVSVESADMKKVPEVARNVTSLINDGVEIESYAPRYLYTKLSELKINMLAEATKDATSRATQIITNANGTLGKLVEAKMGVMQINPKGVTDVSGTGNNDTTSYEKEITAIVTARFELK
ncbi:MAG: SIMPL domain-containing protein [Phycisphaerae bacterium]